METNMDASMEAGALAQHEAESKRYFRRTRGARTWSFVKKFVVAPLLWASRNPVVLGAGFFGGMFFGTPMGETLARSLGWGALATLGTSFLAGGIGAATGALAVFGIGGILNRAAEARSSALAPKALLPASGPEFAQRAGIAMSKMATGRGEEMTWAERQTAALGASHLLSILADAMQNMHPWEGRDVYLRELRNMASMPPMEWGRKEMGVLLEVSNDVGRRQARIGLEPAYQTMREQISAQPFGKKDWKERYLPFLRTPMPETGSIFAEIEAADAETAAERAAETGEPASPSFSRQTHSAPKTGNQGLQESGEQLSRSQASGMKNFAEDFADACDLGGAARRSRRQADAAMEQNLHAAPG